MQKQNLNLIFGWFKIKLSQNLSNMATKMRRISKNEDISPENDENIIIITGCGFTNKRFNGVALINTS